MILFATLSVAARLGGEQQYNAAVVRALAGTPAEVLSLWDGRSECPAGVTGCAGSKVRFALAFLRSLLQKRVTTVVLGHVLLVPLALVVRLVRPGTDVVLLVYGLDVWSRPASARRWLVRSCVDRVIAISGTTAAAMQRAYGLDPGRFYVLAPAVEAVSSSSVGRPQEVPIILSVARLGEHAGGKGIDVVLQALPEVLAACPDARYEVVGDGAGRAALEGLAQALGIGNRVQFCGRLTDDERERAYARASVFVLPSTQEGFGIVFLEAWRHGLPVVGAHAGAAAEVLAGRGVLVPPGDHAALADALIALLADEESRRALGEAGRTALSERYSTEVFERDLRAILRVPGPLVEVAS